MKPVRNAVWFRSNIKSARWKTANVRFAISKESKMSKLNRMEKLVADSLCREAIALLKPLGEKYGLQISNHGGRFTDTCLTSKFEFAIVSDTGVVMTREAKYFSLFAGDNGIDTEALGKTFTHVGDSYTVLGMKPNRRNPIVCKKIGDTKPNRT